MIMGEIADSIINGDFDYITGEYISEGCGYPRTKNTSSFSHSPKTNQYGVTKQLWKTMNERTKSVYMACKGMNNNERQCAIDSFLYEVGYEKLPKNSNKYKVVFERINEFKAFLKNKKL